MGEFEVAAGEFFEPTDQMLNEDQLHELSATATLAVVYYVFPEDAEHEGLPRLEFQSLEELYSLIPESHEEVAARYELLTET